MFARCRVVAAQSASKAGEKGERRKLRQSLRKRARDRLQRGDGDGEGGGFNPAALMDVFSLLSLELDHLGSRFGFSHQRSALDRMEISARLMLHREKQRQQRPHRLEECLTTEQLHPQQQQQQQEGAHSLFDLVYFWNCSNVAYQRSVSNVVKSTFLDVSDLVQTRWHSNALRPAYAIFKDDVEQNIVVSIRGTKDIQDLLHDVNLEAAAFQTGFAHSGMLAAAQSLVQLERDRLLRLRDKHPDHTLRLCGHSLGGSTAAIAALLLRDDFPDVQAYTFGTPSCLSIPLAEAAQDVCTSVITGDDIVPRLSTYNAYRLRKQLEAYDFEEELVDVAQKFKVYQFGLDLQRKVEDVQSHVDQTRQHVKTTLDRIKTWMPWSRDDDDDKHTDNHHPRATGHFSSNPDSWFSTFGGKSSGTGSNSSNSSSSSSNNSNSSGKSRSPSSRDKATVHPALHDSLDDEFDDVVFAVPGRLLHVVPLQRPSSDSLDSDHYLELTQLRFGVKEAHYTDFMDIRLSDDLLFHHTRRIITSSLRSVIRHHRTKGQFASLPLA